MEYGKLIKPEEIPPQTKKFQKTSIVPNILKTIPKNKTLEITNTLKETETHKYTTTDKIKISTIRSYLEKNHRQGKLTQYTIEQRTEYPDKTRQTKIVKLYITHN